MSSRRIVVLSLAAMVGVGLAAVLMLAPMLIKGMPRHAMACSFRVLGMEQHEIVQYIAETFAGVDVVVGSEGIAEGDTFFIYDPHRDLDPKHQFPFATIVTKDYGDFDSASNLNRPGVYRLNVGVSRATFRALFADASDAAYDYSALDQLLPHPVYAPQSWVSVLNPSAETFHVVQPLLAEAYDQAAKRRAPR